MKVTVLMVVYNGSTFLEECVKSVLSQTFTDFEFLIVDDGSEDSTCDIIERFKDSRIRLIHHAHDYIASLNLGLHEAHGQYIARMDSDDLMYPNRLEKQVVLLDSYPEVAACMSWAQSFGEMETSMQSRQVGYIHDVLPELLEGNFVVHPTVMLRKSFLKENSLTYKDYPYAEDYKLWVDMAKVGARFFVIPKKLLRYRVSELQVSQLHQCEQYNTTVKIKNEVLMELLNVDGYVEREQVQTIYKQLESMNLRGNLSSSAVRHIIYVMSKEIRMHVIHKK